MKTPEVLDRPTWIDCEAKGVAHRLSPGVVPGYWDCSRCPVSFYGYPYTTGLEGGRDLSSAAS